VVAAVLDLHIGARPGAEAVDQVTGGLGRRHDVIDLHRFAVTDEIGGFGDGPPGPGAHLFQIADDLIDLGHGGKGLRFGLGSAAGDDQAGIGVLAAQLADLLAGLTDSLAGDGTGVDDDGVL
jgi:hypothetical protein